MTDTTYQKIIQGMTSVLTALEIVPDEQAPTTAREFIDNISSYISKQGKDLKFQCVHFKNTCPVVIKDVPVTALNSNTLMPYSANVSVSMVWRNDDDVVTMPVDPKGLIQRICKCIIAKETLCAHLADALTELFKCHTVLVVMKSGSQTVTHYKGSQDKLGEITNHLNTLSDLCVR